MVRQGTRIVMGENLPVYAHSFRGMPEAGWEPLGDHLGSVARLAASFAAQFGWCELARAAGLLHDIGKCSADFQAYLKRSVASAERLRGPDHSTAGARAASLSYPGNAGLILAHVIAGHHCGLTNWPNLKRRLDEAACAIPNHRGWERFTGPLPPRAELSNPSFKSNKSGWAFGHSFLIRMLFSALVDADSLATEAAVAQAEGQRIRRGGYRSLNDLRDRLDAYMAVKEEAALGTPTELNRIRARVLRCARGKAEMEPGFFTLTVPTGGGKTLTSLAFALEHAVRKGLRRVIYVIPYTSIIEQTADVFREALSTSEDVLEHHATFDWDRNMEGRAPDAEGSSALRRLRLATENWNAPIVVTTAVQFYESLFANRRSRCRKLHNLAGSVILLDEAHVMPLKYLLPAMAALDQLQRNYGATVVLCSATQPALRLQDGFADGFDIPDERELAPDPAALYEALDRFDIDWREEPVSDAAIAERFAEQSRMLVVVNTRAHAGKLFGTIKNLPGGRHLSTLMCPAHRRKVLESIRADLKSGRPVRLVSTSLIECGVDVDFPEVWRAAAGLDSILQAGGRCAREGGPERGRLVVFQPLEEKLRDERLELWCDTQEVRRNNPGPSNRVSPIRAYFSKAYWNRRDGGLDAAMIDGRKGILPAIAERSKMAFPFADIAEAFVMIEDEKEPVIVPWRADQDDRTAETILGRIAAMEHPSRDDLRKLGQYAVGISPKLRGFWLSRHALKPVHPALGDTLLKFDGLFFYDERTGLNVGDPELLPLMEF